MGKLRHRGKRSSATTAQRIECFMSALKANEIVNGKKCYSSKRK